MQFALFAAAMLVCGAHRHIYDDRGMRCIDILQIQTGLWFGALAGSHFYFYVPMMMIISF